MMILEGMPLVLLELAAGQKFRQGAYGVWNMIHPWLGGIGVGSTVIAVVVGCYYNMIIAWCIYYLINSFWVSSNSGQSCSVRKAGAKGIRNILAYGRMAWHRGRISASQPAVMGFNLSTAKSFSNEFSRAVQ